MTTVVHDGEGTWFAPEALLASSLTEEQFEDLESGDELVLSGTGDPLLGYGPGDSLTALTRIVSLWLPDAVIDEAIDGELIVYTGLRSAGGMLERHG